MRKGAKWAIMAGGGIFVLIIIILLLIPSFVDLQKFRAQVESQVSKALGRTVSLKGDLSFSVFPWAGISLSGFSVENPPGFAEKEFLKIESFEVRVKLIPLLSKNIQAKGFILKKPMIFLEKNKEGVGNWEGIGKSGAAPKDEKQESSEGKLFKTFFLDELLISDGYILWIDHSGGGKKEVSDLNLRVQDFSPDRSMDLSFSCKLDGRPLSLKGKAGPFGSDPGRGEIPFDLTAAALDQVQAALKGRVIHPAEALEADLDVQVSPFSPRKLMKGLGRPFPVETGDPGAMDRLGLALHIRKTPDALTISNGMIEMDQSKLNVSLEAKDFLKPDLKFDISADTVDLNRYLPPPKGKSADETRKPAGKQQPDLSRIQTMIVDGKLRIGSLKYPSGQFQDVRMAISGREGRFDLEFSSQKDSLPIVISGRVGPIKNQGIPIDMNVKALNELDVSLKGGMDIKTRQGNMMVQIQPFSPRKLMEVLGQKFPVETADPEALNRMAFKGQIQAGDQFVSVSDAHVNLDQSTAVLSFKTLGFTHPDIAFNVNLDRMDLDRYLPPRKKTDPAAAPGGGDSTQPPKEGRSPLKTLSLKGTAKIGRLKAALAQFENIHLTISGEKGMFRIDPLTLDLYKGKVRMEGSSDFREDVPKTGFSLQVRGVQAGPLLKDVADKDFLEGGTSADITMKLTGTDAVQIRRSLNGNGNILFTDGAIKGIDLTQMTQNVKTAFGVLQKTETAPRTDFSELKADFTVGEGVFKIPQAAFLSPLLRATASGQADLSTQTLDFQLYPKFVKSLKGKGDDKTQPGFMVPVLISGTFSAPTFQPDINGMIQMVPEDTVSEILKDPKGGLKKFLEQKKSEIGSVLSPSEDKAPDQKNEESIEDTLGDFIKGFPFGQPSDKKSSRP